jgi:hypothetical protein
MCAGEVLLPLFGDADEVVSVRSKPKKVGLRTGILRLGVLMDDTLF